MIFKSFTLAELKSMNIDKNQLAKLMGLNIPGVIYDYAIPLDWIESFLFIYKDQITYDMFISTTMWVYIEGDTIGRPVSGCTEVQVLINKQ